jgi:hypothetical protein
MVTEATWNDVSGKWNLKIRHRNEDVEDKCDILIDGSGFLKYVHAEATWSFQD